MARLTPFGPYGRESRAQCEPLHYEGRTCQVAGTLPFQFEWWPFVVNIRDKDFGLELRPDVMDTSKMVLMARVCPDRPWSDAPTRSLQISLLSPLARPAVVDQCLIERPRDELEAPTQSPPRTLALCAANTPSTPRYQPRRPGSSRPPSPGASCGSIPGQRTLTNWRVCSHQPRGHAGTFPGP